MDDKTAFEQLAGLSVVTRRLSAGLKRLGDPSLLLARIKWLENDPMSFRRSVQNKASNTYPFTYVASIPLAAATTRVQANLTISQFGWFFADRIFASWLPSAGVGTLNMWAPIGRSNPFIAGAGAIVVPEVQNQLNFFLEYADIRTQQSRQNLPIPGDLLYRGDGDGYLLPGGDGFGPNTTVSLFVTPTVAPQNAGTLYICFNGVQCHDVLPQ
jgi:hypothetical protein